MSFFLFKCWLLSGEIHVPTRYIITTIITSFVIGIVIVIFIIVIIFTSIINI